MDSIGRPVGEDPRDPYKYKVDEIQKDRQAKENPEGASPEPPEKPIFSAYLLLLFRKFLELFEETNEKGLTASTEEEVKKHLKQLRSLLEVLKAENRSQDSPFLNQLSNAWHQILEDSLLFKKATPLSKSFRAFLKQIQHYPQNQEHTLGYYLTEYAGQKWLPFPYMELIQKIHVEHQNDPETSALSQWTREIEELFKALS